ncbi:MAG TPA: alpha/beta hydrolase [Rhodospirillales bacterium]|nr:alpha/beta hydrolase [Rhodospirillales bacterium]
MPEVIFNGPEGRLEGRYHHSPKANGPIALVLHPHPLHGGTMNNKVTYALYQTFVKRGFSVLRFNFRGVGRSQGQFDSGIGEMSDAAAALDWMQTHTPNTSTCWIGGFSFGAWIAMQLMMRRPEIGRFISISPPAEDCDFTFLAPCPSSGQIIHGEKDEVVPKDSVDKLAAKISSQKNITIDYDVIPGADHFFSKDMDTLNSLVGNYLDKSFSDKTA